MISDAKPRVLISGQRYVNLVDSLVNIADKLQHKVVLEEPANGWHFYDDLIKSNKSDEIFPADDGSDLTMIMFTAGTTGSAKGVMLSHGAIIANWRLHGVVSQTEIEEAIKKKAQEVTRIHKALHQDYDRRTNHGKSQGARFP